MNQTRRNQIDQVREAGGDIASVIQRIRELDMQNPGWYYDLRFDESGVLTAAFWMSP